MAELKTGMNNYCLRRLRYALSLNDSEVLNLFKLASYSLAPTELKSYLAKEDDKLYVPLPDYLIVIFLDGLIISKRGRREGDEVLTQAESVAKSKKVKINNNVMLNKIKIAMSLTTDELCSILELADFRISKSEISAFFRKPDHRNYRECGNQFIRNMLTGLTLQLIKPNSDTKNKKPANRQQKPANKKAHIGAAKSRSNNANKR